MKVPPEELSFTFARSSGAGGQNVNKVNSKVTLHWFPLQSSLPVGVKERFIERHRNLMTAEGDVQIVSQKTRNQKDNIADCVEKLEEMLEAVKFPPKKRKATKPTRGSVERRLSSKKRHSEKKRSRRGDW